MATWIKKRYGANVDPDCQVLPVNGTREALFSFGQTVLSGAPGSRVLLPNPFYQIYEGAALLRGATPYYIPCLREHADLPDFDSVEDDIWKATELVYLCSPGNPSGAVLPSRCHEQLIELAHRFDFVIAADECYSEIYYDEEAPPIGLLQTATSMGYTGFDRCIVFHSLSKRSNLPGLRSGFVAGDAALIQRYYQYRTYHGCAMPQHIQSASVLAWQDEAHVIENRSRYRAKFDAVFPLLREVVDVSMPEAAFYLWPKLPVEDELFARELFVNENVTVLPGTYLGRGQDGVNPGTNRVRIALVAEQSSCVEAIERIRAFILRMV